MALQIIFLVLQFDNLVSGLFLLILKDGVMLIVKLLKLLALGGEGLLILLKVFGMLLHHLRMLFEALLEHIVILFKSCIGLNAHTKVIRSSQLYLLKLLLLSDHLRLS